MPGREIPLWFMFLLETQSYCNLKCPNCLRNTEPTKSRSKRGKPIRKEMPTEKVHDLIDQASELGYNGTIQFQYYSEPTCDPRLVSFAKYARHKGMLPEVATNGTLLTNELCRELDGVIDKIVIGVANRNPREYWLPKFHKTRVVSVFLDRPEAWLTTHFSPQKERLQAAISKNINSPCHIPYKYLIIQYDGEMSLCCDDLSHAWEFGNASETSLEELWWSKKHVETLKRLSVAGGRSEHPYCRICPAEDINLEADYNTFYRGTSYLNTRPTYGELMAERIPLSVKDQFREGLFKTWEPEKRSEKWLARLPQDVVDDTCPQGKIVLDAGTGKGRFAIAFARGGAERVVAVDISPVMLKLAYEEAEKENVSDRIVFEIGDVESLEYPDNTFDIACCMATTMHLPYPSKAILELERVCNVGGVVVVDTSITEKPKQGGYWKSFTEDEFLKLFEGTDLKIEHKRRYGMEGVETSTITVIANKAKTK